MTKSIPLTQGKFAIVDDEDYEYLTQWNWQYRGGYAARSVRKAGEKRKSIFMHRVINETPSDMQTDHIDQNKLNNSRGNLRSCSIGENGRNRKLQINNKSGFRGVYSNKNKWYASIGINGKRIYLGTFQNKIDAAIKYNEQAKIEYGEFAVLNSYG